MAIPKIQTGARAVLKIGDQVVTFANSVSYRIGTPNAPIITLGRYSVARHEPVGYDVSVTCSSFRYTDNSNGNSPDSQNLSPKFVPTLNELINSDEVKIEILDRATDRTILVVERCRMTDRSGNLGARDVLSETWTFVGVIARSDDSGPQAESSGSGSIPPNNKAGE